MMSSYVMVYSHWEAFISLVERMWETMKLFFSFYSSNAFFKKLENFVAVQACIPHTDFIEK
ncbi:MAG: hypothetical protein KC548_06020, partial [Nanoarchaeota archaeon]|nr:hypothetical protein [Nanoarchaeota archaeon]